MNIVSQDAALVDKYGVVIVYMALMLMDLFSEYFSLLEKFTGPTAPK
jgi:hypothetical protein